LGKIWNMPYRELYNRYMESAIRGRYLTLNNILPLLKEHSTTARVILIGESVNGLPLLAYQIGNGTVKILMWSQMHGNESTGTKALFDLFNLLGDDSELSRALTSRFTFCIVPMLNPDGALAYTRENANGIDLNRDFHNLTQPESKALTEIFEQFEPDYCYNIHDQRTIFGVGNPPNPATLSFLAPAFNQARDINACRQKAVDVIVAMNRALQGLMPGHIGRFDDTFNINCVGDNFQFRGVPTILIEAGHYPQDYDREQTRFYFFASLIAGFMFLIENDIVVNAIDEYLNIPQNKVVFFDFVYRNVNINYDGIEKITNFAAQYKEELVGDSLQLNAYIVEVGALQDHLGHIELDGHGKPFDNNGMSFPEIGQKANFSIGNDVKIVNGLKKM